MSQKRTGTRAALALIGLGAIIGIAGSGASPAPARADAQDACKAAQDRISWIPSLWREGQMCGDLADDTKSVRPDPWGEGLRNFRAVKSDFMSHFDASSPSTVGHDLEQLADSASAYVKAHPEKAETAALLQQLVDRVGALKSAVDAMRPDGQTTPPHVAAIDDALAKLQNTCADQREGQYNKASCQGPGILDTALEKLPAGDAELAKIRSDAAAITGGHHLGDAGQILDRMHCILTCRLNDEQLARDRAKINTPECKGDVTDPNQPAAKDPLAYTRSVLGPAIQFCQSNPTVNDCPTVLKQTDLVATYGNPSKTVPDTTLGSGKGGPRGGSASGAAAGNGTGGDPDDEEDGSGAGGGTAPAPNPGWVSVHLPKGPSVDVPSDWVNPQQQQPADWVTIQTGNLYTPTLQVPRALAPTLQVPGAQQ